MRGDSGNGVLEGTESPKGVRGDEDIIVIDTGREGSLETLSGSEIR